MEKINNSLRYKGSIRIYQGVTKIYQGFSKLSKGLMIHSIINIKFNIAYIL